MSATKKVFSLGGAKGFYLSREMQRIAEEACSSEESPWTLFNIVGVGFDANTCDELALRAQQAANKELAK